ncbi:unnamed protein product [Porites evermanni]|uniref:Uncharacterized protein n=1 Tax=Porites evermanni TaxID=104178 RepID=A0ABN8Q9Z5_9CNID|nr:unnamed protein product [Porites evermanni]
MDAGKHVRASDLDCESVYDAAQKKWADRVGEMHVASGDRQRIAFEEAEPSSARERRNKGWALKSTKRTNRMEEKVKAFLAIGHPIKIEAVNVCELSRAGKQSSLKLAQLREVCRALSLQTNGSNSRKRTFTEPLMPTLSCAHVGNN